jgi:hypothetical protein
LDWSFQAFSYPESVHNNHLQDVEANTAPGQVDSETRRDVWWAYVKGPSKGTGAVVVSLIHTSVWGVVMEEKKNNGKDDKIGCRIPPESQM